MNKPKVLYYPLEEFDTSSLYRISGVLPYLPKDDYEIVDGAKITDWNWSVFTGVKIFIIQRPCMDWHIDIIMLAKNMGVKVILDYDDNVLVVDPYNPTYEIYRGFRKQVMTCLKLADEVWVTTDGIKNSFNVFNDNVYIIPNAHNDYLLPIENKKEFNIETKKVLWRGGHSHQSDIDDVKEQLVETINNNKDWNFNFWGDSFLHIIKRTGDNCLFMGYLTPMEYFKALLDFNPNIVIFPLSETELNRSKSNICWMEASYAGAAFFGNNGLPEFNKKGIMSFENVETAFKSKYVKILENLNKISWQFILENLLLSKINELRNDRILKNL